jgi:hypothetical protein
MILPTDCPAWPDLVLILLNSVVSEPASGDESTLAGGEPHTHPVVTAFVCIFVHKETSDIDTSTCQNLDREQYHWLNLNIAAWR